jgi:hypothetical protein
VQETIPVLEDMYEYDSLDSFGLDKAEVVLEVLDTHILMLFRTIVGVQGGSATFNRLILVDWVTGVVVAVSKLFTMARYDVLQRAISILA